MPRSISIALLSFLAVGPALAQLTGDVAVRERSASSLVIEFAPRYQMRAVSGASGEEFLFPGFTGGILPEAVPGQAMIPYRSLPLDLPGQSWSVEVLETTHRDTSGVRLAPFPVYRSDEEFGATPEFIAEPGREEFRPVASVDRIRLSGRSPESILSLFPVQYDEGRRVVRLYERIVVRISSTGVPSPRTQTPSRTDNTGDSPLKVGEWYKMDVSVSGIYKIDRTLLLNAGIPAAAISDMHAVRIFGNGGRPLPEDLAVPRPAGLQEIARTVVDRNGNGTFDADDFLLFYGASPRGWSYNPSTKTFGHYLNPYTETNSYFLTFGGGPGRTMDSVGSANDPTPFVPEDFLSTIFFEEEQSNLINSGRQWYGPRFDAETRTAVFMTLLPGHVAGKPTTYRVALLSRSPVLEAFQLQENSVNLGGPVFIPGMDVTSIENHYANASATVVLTRTGSLPDNRSALRFTFQANSPVGMGWLDWFEIHYCRRFQAVSDVLAFTSPDTTAPVSYRLSGFSPVRDIRVFDVSAHDSVVRIVGLNYDPVDPGACEFQVVQDSGGVREFMAVGPGGYLAPENIRRVENTNLRGISGGAEYVIIAPREFQAEAERLKSYRQGRDSVTGLVVDVENIFNEYSGGLPDPIALRDFLLDAASTWTIPPRYLLLLGDGHFDYKNIRTTNRNWIPPYETHESLHQINSYASDDHFGFLTPGDLRVSLAIGRLPVNSVAEAAAAVDKIIAYETSAPFDAWRNRITYVADDGLTSTRDEGSIHTFQAEVLAQNFTPASIEKRKIYIIEYPTVNSSAGRRKPAANAAIIEAVNEGTLVLNYTGHGNPQLWAHEAIFTRETSLPQLRNGTREFLLVAATCDFARYDNAGEESAGELILRMPQGGAIAVLTASRAVYSFQNSQFNNTFYGELFRREPDGRYPRLGDALRRTKLTHFNINDRKYHLFGDPMMRLNLPVSVAGVDSVDGVPGTSVAQVKALSRIGIRGRIRKPDGSAWNAFTGRALLEMFDSKRRVIVSEWNNFSFELNGSLLYRGEISVTGGSFQATVPIPKDVSYDNNRARVAIYAWTSSADAVGFTENVVIAGTDSAAVPDTVGPVVDIFLQDESFRSGDVVPPDALLLVKLFDQNGINTSTASVGHRLEAVVSTSPEPVNLTNYYRGDLDTYQSGEVRYMLTGLPEGRHSLRVKAWDTYNNSAEEEVVFEVRAASDVNIHNVFNFPNPFGRSTMFTFQRNSSEPIDVEIRIYTVAGRFVKSLKVVSVIDRFVQIPWDGRDQNGDPMANGLYFYKVITRTPSGAAMREVIGKLSILR